MRLSLDDREAALLRNVLDRHLSSLKEEVYKTENFQMRQELKADEALLKGIIARLEPSHV
jgi:hypothetical protein